MTDTRILTWTIISFAFILFLPILRKIINSKNSYILEGFGKSFSFTIVAAGIISYLYYSTIIRSPEFIFLSILLVVIYFYSGFNKTEYSWKQSNSTPIFSEDILKSIARTFGGSKVETTEYGFTFVATTPYQLKYQIDAVSGRNDKPGAFLLTAISRNLIPVKLLNMLTLYLIIQAMVSDNEISTIPLINYDVNAVLAVLISISTTLVILYLEIDTANNIISTLPVIYSKLLQKEALSRLDKGTVKPNVNVNVKKKAQNIIDKRNSNLIKAKKEAVEGKLSTVFGEKETIPLDKKSIERMRLMETVKRILNSTPPWSKVTLKDISELAKGNEEEVEIIIAGLRELNEVSGIYDIWTKSYHGTSSSHWLITKILNDIPNEKTSVDHVKIYPDGGGEFSIKNSEE